MAALVTNDGSCSILYLPTMAPPLENNDQVPVLSDSSVTLFTIPVDRHITCCSWSCKAGEELLLVTGSDHGEVLLWDFRSLLAPEAEGVAQSPKVSEAFLAKAKTGGENSGDRITSIGFCPSAQNLEGVSSFGGRVRVWSTVATKTHTHPLQKPLLSWVAEGTKESPVDDETRYGAMRQIEARAGSVVQNAAWGFKNSVFVGFNDSPALCRVDCSAGAGDETENGDAMTNPLCSPSLSHLGTTWALKTLQLGGLGPMLLSAGSSGAVCLMSLLAERGKRSDRATAIVSPPPPGSVTARARTIRASSYAFHLDVPRR